MSMKFLKNRRFKHGSLATIITVIVIVALIIVNIVATLLLERFPLNIDLTKDNRFQLTDESIEFVETLEDEVKMTVCADELVFKNAGEWYKQAYEIIKSYTKYGNKIKLSFVDPTKDPTFAQKYPEYKLATGDIIVETDLRTRKVGLNDIIRYTQTEYGQTIYSSEAEQVMTSAIMYVTDKNPVSASILAGVDNADITGYTDMLASNNYEMTYQNILTDEIDKNADMIIMGAPAADLTMEQVKKIEAFLDNDGKFGKSMVFVASKDYPVGPILQSFLAEWGMAIDPGVIVETNNANAVSDNFTMINQVVDEEINSYLKTATLPLVTRLSNSIDVLFETDGNRTTKVIASTSPTTYVLPLDADENFDPNEQELKTHNVIVKCNRDKYIGNDLMTSTVAVVGSDAMLQPMFIQNPGFNNGDVMVNLANQLTAKEDVITMLPVVFQNESIAITQEQVSVFSVVFIFIIPVAIIVLGAIIFLRRRHL